MGKVIVKSAGIGEMSGLVRRKSSLLAPSRLVVFGQNEGTMSLGSDQSTSLKPMTLFTVSGRTTS